MNLKEDEGLVIIGTSRIAELMYEYFTYDSKYTVVGFSAEREYITQDKICNLPVVPFSELESHFNPEDYSAFVAIGYKKMNRLRERFYNETKSKGFNLISYCSTDAYFGPKHKVGKNVAIFEDNTIQPFAVVGDDVVMWSGNHLGHDSVIGDHCFVSSHVVISGYTNIGQHCFLGVNSTIINNINIADNCMIGAGAVVTKDTEEGKVYVGNPAKPLPKSVSEVNLK